MFPVYLIVVLILSIIFIIVVSLLVIPFGVSFQFLKDGKIMRGRFALSWLGLTFVRRDIPSKRAKKKGGEEKKKRSFSNLVKKVLSISPDSLSTLPPIFGALRKSVRVKEISGSLTIGLVDPSDTAFVSGCMWSIVSTINAIPRTSFFVYTDFENERLDASISAKLKVRMLRIALSLIRAFTKKPFRDLIGAIRQ
jgi:hypothetical protein